VKVGVLCGRVDALPYPPQRTLYGFETDTLYMLASIQ